jgi:hypothetical protein
VHQLPRRFEHTERLADDEICAVTADVLYLDDPVGDDLVLDRDGLAAFELPDRGRSASTTGRRPSIAPSPTDPA